MPAARVLGAALAVAFVVVSAGCRRTPTEVTGDDASVRPVTGIAITAERSDAAAPRPGMAWIPPGSFPAGTPVGRVPRIADEEMPGVPVAMQGFYIDLLPYPNEPGAIPTTNVTREEAEQLCAAKGKRLCSELEWERACKGEAGATYEYGETYRPAACGTGVSAEEGARRPSGELAQCKSSFGVADMHGGVWQWTSSRWGRGNESGTLGVLRGGNAVAGELVGRCANAIGRPVAKKSSTMGLRCCAGAKNDAEVQLGTKPPSGLLLASKMEPIANALGSALPEGAHAGRAYRWTPVANDDLVVLFGCTRASTPACTFVAGRMPAASGDAGAASGAGAVVTKEGVGLVLPDLARTSDPKRVLLRGIDTLGTFSREVTYVYGRVDFGPMKRP